MCRRADPNESWRKTRNPRRRSPRSPNLVLPISACQVRSSGMRQLLGLTRVARSLVPASVAQRTRKTLERRYRRSFSKCGEDAVLAYLFKLWSDGFYVDVGAFHPVANSNTFHFYRLGWRGINIDARPSSMAEFARLRPRDVNIEGGVSDETGRTAYLMFTESQSASEMNTLEPRFAADHGRTSGGTVVRVETRTLRDVLREHVPPGQAIAFYSIDVEGSEARVLRSNDWERFPACVVLLESFDLLTTTTFDYEIREFLGGRGYELLFKTPNGAFFVNGNVGLTSANQIVPI
jgi:FkbM family methyltransferase